MPCLGFFRAEHVKEQPCQVIVAVVEVDCGLERFLEARNIVLDQQFSNERGFETLFAK